MHPGRRRVRRRREADPQVAPVEPAAPEEEPMEEAPQPGNERDSEYTPSIAPEDRERAEAVEEVPEEPMAPVVQEEEREERPRPVRPEDIPVPEDDDDDSLPQEWHDMERMMASREEWRGLDPEERRQRLADDLPRQLKRKLIDREDQLDPGFTDEKRRRISPGLVTHAVLGAVEPGPDNEWVTRYELTLLRQLTGLPVTAARIHRSPRKRFMRPPKMVSRSRLTIMIGKEPVDSFIVRETTEEVQQNPRRKASFPWRGMTIFVKGEIPEEPKEQKIYPTYIRSHHGLYQVDLNYEQRTAFEEAWVDQIKDALMAEVMVLKLKQSGKELDPKAFDNAEWEKFKESDSREWEQWVDNGVMRRIPREQEHQIPRYKIFRSPLRMVRTNRSGGVMQPLIAKSRLVVPGHLDPGLGLFRTDAPTTSQVATRLAKATAAARGWDAWSFDVTTAFLSGDNTDREIYVRAPGEGLPGVRGQTPVAPGELLQILKSAYGLTEATLRRIGRWKAHR